MPTVSVNGVALDFATTGKATDPALILVRGTGAQRVRWQGQLLEGLAGYGLRAITFDNRDVGKSTWFEEHPTPSLGEFVAQFMKGQTITPAYTLEDMARDVVGLMDGLQIDRAHILGLSMGGYIGQIVAAKYPKRARSYISLMSSPRLPGFDRMAPAIAELIMRGAKGADEESQTDHAIAVATIAAGNVFPLDEAALRNVLKLERERGIAPGGETRQIMATMVTGDRTAICAQISVPTLVLHGTADPMVPFSEAEELARLVRGGVLKPIEGAGHEITPTLVPVLVREIGSFCTRA